MIIILTLRREIRGYCCWCFILFQLFNWLFKLIILLFNWLLHFLFSLLFHLLFNLLFCLFFIQLFLKLSIIMLTALFSSLIFWCFFAIFSRGLWILNNRFDVFHIFRMVFGKIFWFLLIILFGIIFFSFIFFDRLFRLFGRFDNFIWFS